MATRNRGTLIYLKDRNVTMQKQDIILKSPLGGMAEDTCNRGGGFSALLARNGVGKTAFLVQLALNAMARDRNVLHVSLSDPVKKVTLRYRELFDSLVDRDTEGGINELWHVMLRRRFIMTFRKTSFSVPRFKERLTDLTAQEIFTPHLIIIDGLTFDEGVEEQLIALKELAQNNACPAWFSITTHRDEATNEQGMPLSFSRVSDFFETILALKPEGGATRIEMLQGQFEAPPVILDPSSMLIKTGNDG